MKVKDEGGEERTGPNDTIAALAVCLRIPD